jgi:hypothetical protein
MADTELQPRFWVPLGVVGLGLACGLLSWIAAAVVVLFGCFLMLQTALLRLRFESEALVVTRSGDEIRRFPYSDWMGWRVFWPAVPVLFYFREVNSIHFLPMLFDANALNEQLTTRIGPSETHLKEAVPPADAPRE